MKHHLRLTLCSFVICLLSSSLTTKAQKKPEFFLPASAFDSATAYKMLEEGTNTIQGRISLKKRGYVNYPGFKEKVLLFPVTQHLLEYLELQKKYNSKTKQAAMTKEASMARIETKTIDSKGNFVFTDLKPGKYYIVSLVIWEKVTSSQVVSGPTVANRNIYGVQIGAGYTPTETHYDATAHEREVGDFIEITGDGKVVTVTIAK